MRSVALDDVLLSERATSVRCDVFVEVENAMGNVASCQDAGAAADALHDAARAIRGARDEHADALREIGVQSATSLISLDWKAPGVVTAVLAVMLAPLGMTAVGAGIALVTWAYRATAT